MENESQVENTNVYCVISPLWILYKITGLWTFSLSKDRHKIYTSACDKILFVLSVSLHIYLFADLALSTKNFENYGTKLTGYAWQSLLMLSAILTIVKILHNFLKRRDIEEFINILWFFDKEVINNHSLILP